ncbi:MAG: sulfotransferase, partial [Anderseniella sp.]|nr:sulfotransferase [Anderseniella sp.]
TIAPDAIGQALAADFWCAYLLNIDFFQGAHARLAGPLVERLILLNMPYPQPLIILCTMRSYSSLVSTMLGRHPDLYGLPELNLSVADTIEEMVQYYRRRNRPHGMHGLLRALAELQFGEQSDASVAQAVGWLSSRREWSTKRVFEHIAELVAPRILVEKSPITCKERRFLLRVHRHFPKASYLHLVRHPRAVGNSIYQLLRRNDGIRPSGRPIAELIDPERVWLRTNKNASDFIEQLPLGQGMRIQGEMLLGDPDNYLHQIAEWLDIRTHPEAIEAMKHPDESPYACLGPAKAQFGNDPNFLEHPEFRLRPITQVELPGELEWLANRGGGQFSAATLKLARTFGYA